MKKVFSLILALGLIASLTACGGGNASGNETGDSAPAASTAKLRFVTGGESGTYYAFGGVLASFVSGKSNCKVTALTSGGSQANVEDLTNGNVQLAFVQSDVMNYAYNGQRLFDSPVTGFSVVAQLYQEQVQIVTTNPDIKTVADLAGKKVSIGAAGSGVYFNAIDVLSAYDLKESDISAVYQSFGDSAESLKDGKIDAAFTVAGAPTTAIVDYATTNTLNLVSLTDEELAAIQEAYPFLIRDDLPSTTYTGMTGDVVCVAIQATLVASEELSEDVVYEFVKAMFDNKDALTEGHAKFGFLDPEAASAGATVTMHPGAEKYYKEIGVL